MRSTLTGNKNLDIDILNKLDDKDLVSFCKTSKYANQLCNDQILWQRRVMDRFGYIPLEVMKKYKGDRKWSDYYIELSQKIRTTFGINTLLIDSAFAGRLDFVMLALNNGANIHSRNDYALQLASQKGYLDIVKYLVENGADIRADKDYALQMTSAGGHLEIVKYLVEKGADIHALDDLSLLWASENGHLEVVKYLVDKGGDIHTFDDYALRLTSKTGHLDVVKYLVSQGANIHAENDYALRYARRNEHTDIVKYLEEQINKEQTNNL